MTQDEATLNDGHVSHSAMPREPGLDSNPASWVTTPPSNETPAISDREMINACFRLLCAVAQRLTDEIPKVRVRGVFQAVDGKPFPPFSQFLSATEETVIWTKSEA